MKHFWLDFETYCTLDIKKVGGAKYAEQAEVIMMQYAINDGPVKVITDYTNMRSVLFEANKNKDIQFIAHNAAFDRRVMQYALGITPALDRWYCSSVKAYSHGLPGTLENLGAAFGLPKDKAKIKDGKKLIKLFCVPNKNGERNMPHQSPEQWAKFIEYGKRDVEAMRVCWNLIPNINYPKRDQSDWILDQEINDYGICFDIELANACIALCKEASKQVNEELFNLTDGAVKTVGQVKAILDWAHGNGANAIDLPNTQRGTLENFLKFSI